MGLRATICCAMSRRMTCAPYFGLPLSVWDPSAAEQPQRLTTRNTQQHKSFNHLPSNRCPHGPCSGNTFVRTQHPPRDAADRAVSSRRGACGWLRAECVTQHTHKFTIHGLAITKPIQILCKQLRSVVNFCVQNQQQPQLCPCTGSAQRRVQPLRTPRTRAGPPGGPAAIGFSPTPPPPGSVGAPLGRRTRRPGCPRPRCGRRAPGRCGRSPRARAPCPGPAVSW